MSTSARSSAGTWIISLLGVLVLYVATWPLIEIKSMVAHTTTPATGTSLEIVTVSYTPAWTQVIYFPLDSLRDSNGRDNLLSRYWGWWFNILS